MSAHIEWLSAADITATFLAKGEEGPDGEPNSHPTLFISDLDDSVGIVGRPEQIRDALSRALAALPPE